MPLAPVHGVGPTRLLPSPFAGFLTRAGRAAFNLLATHDCLSKPQETEQSLVNGLGRHKEARLAAQPTLCANSDTEEDMT